MVEVDTPGASSGAEELFAGPGEMRARRRADSLDDGPESVAAVVHPDDVGPMFDAIHRASNEERQAFFLKLSDVLRPLSDPAKIKLTATQLLGEHLGVNRVFYADAEGGQWLVTKGYEVGVDPLPDHPFTMSDYGNWIIDGFKAGRKLVVDDMNADSRFAEDERANHLALQIGAEVALPLVKSGELAAMLVMHCVSPREWSEREMILLEETVERTWAARFL